MLDYMQYMTEHRHEQIVLCFDQDTGLRAFIGVHSTTLGPGLGGIRLWQYESSEAAMLDVLRLSEGMTYKAAVAGLALGGGKTVVMADGKEADPRIRSARFQALGRYIDSLNGRYIGAEDVGTKPGDMVEIRKVTRHVTGLPVEQGGSGDPSPVTAFGVWRGIQALVEEVFHTDSLKGVRVAIQGLGKVGLGLAEHLMKDGAIVVGTDIVSEKIKAAQAKNVKVVDPDAIYDVDCDIFAPCALGAVLNTDTIPRLKCKVVAGAANNQLAEPCHADMLESRGIVYAVDYVINAGGLINVAHEVARPYSREDAYAKAGNIYYTIKRMLKLAENSHLTTRDAAQQMAMEALQQTVPTH